MKRVSNYLKMRVLGALEHAPGDSFNSRYRAVSEMVFHDEDGRPRRFTWRTIQTWWYHYRRHGITENPVRADKGAHRKISPEDVLAAIEKTLPSFHSTASGYGKRSGKNKPRHLNIQALYRACIEQGRLRRDRIAPNPFRRIVKRHDLLKPDTAESPKRRLAFAKAHANDLWQTDTLHGPRLRFRRGEKPVQVFLICFIDDASRVITHGEFHTADDAENLISTFQTALYKRGLPKAVYADNGSNYSAKEFARVCTRPGTVLIHTPVRDGASKGKIERFFRTVRDQFLVRDLGDVSSLRELNDLFIRGVEDICHTREHSTPGMRPIDRFGLDRVRHLSHCEFNAELFFLETHPPRPHRQHLPV